MISFLGFGQVPYIGAPSPRAIKLGSINSQTIPLLFQWLSYGASTSRPNINVLVDIENAVCRAMDQIRSVYIDNLGSPNAVYVYFPDTQYTVVAKPNSEGWYPAYTNAKKFWVIGLGFLTGQIPQTAVTICNVAMEPSVNNELDNAVALWRASPLISRGNSIYNSALGIPALGDQFFASQFMSFGAGNTAPLWNTPYPSGFLYITSIVINAVNISDPVSTLCGLDIESTGISGLLANFSFVAKPAVVVTQQQPPAFNLVTMSNMQLKLDATQTWRMQANNSIAVGGIQLYSSFTQQP